MKKILILTLLLLPSFLWAQNNKRFLYMLQQIAANKVYIEYLEKGYSIARKGLNTIHDIKKGDFNLHKGFFASLATVNPKIKGYKRVADIIAYQTRIVKTVDITLRSLKESRQFDADELDYNKAVFDNLLEECLKNMDELLLLITSNEFRMKDDERINRIDKLHKSMQDKYSFSQSFSGDCSVLAMQRLTEQAEISMSKKLNDVE